MNSRKSLPIVMLLLVASVKCDSDRGPDLVIDTRGVGAFHFGMRYDQVLERYGTPDRTGFASGARGWSVLRYFSGDANGFTLLFDEGGSVELELDARPLDLIGVDTPNVSQTLAGIRIGSTEQDLLKAYGPPDSSSTVIRFYCLDGLHSEFFVNDETVKVMYFGYSRHTRDVSVCIR